MNKSSPTRFRLRPIAVAVAAVVMAGCAVRPVPLTQPDVAARVQADRAVMYRDQEPIAGPITFHEAAARALKYNLDYRLKLMESALSQGLLDVSRYDMLPRLTATAGYVTRNNSQGGTSVGIEDGLESLRPSSTQERNRTLAGVELSWNILDFGVSYYRSRQQANQVMIAEERRRRVAQTVLQDVRAAYWRAAGAQRLIAQVDQLLVRTNQALVRARQIESQGLMPQPQALGYQRALLDATTILQLRRQDLELAQAELAALMNVPPGTRFTLADSTTPNLPAAPNNIAELENLALNQRPELREEDYRKRITADEIRRAIVSTLPGIGVNYGFNYDSNKYLYNNDWWEGGIRLSFNIMRLFALPAINRANEAQQRTDDFRRMALSMAILTQTRIAAQRYGLAQAELAQVEESARVDQRLVNFARAAEKTRVDAELETIRAEARAMLSEYQRHIAYSNAQAAWGRLYNSIGLDVLPEEIEKSDVKSLAAAIERTMGRWESTTFQAPARRSEVLPPVNVVVLNVPDPQVRTLAANALTEALGRYDVPVVPKGAEARAQLIARLNLHPVSSGTRRAQWDLLVTRPDGSVSGRTSYTTVLASDVTPAQVQALAHSLIDASANELPGWLVERQPAVAAGAPRAN